MKQQTYNIRDLVCEISFNSGKSFKEQLLNDEAFQILSGLYGKNGPKVREIIETDLKWLFQDFNQSYYETALATLKMGGLILDVLYHGNVTIEN